MENKTYIAIDLKSFFASVECVNRGLDPLKERLVVADESRTDKTICLAVTPALKAIGIPGRPRLYEARAIAKKHNVDFIVAKPQMGLYMKTSSKIVGIYNRYISMEDMHKYSVDEVFIDATKYLKLYNISARELAMKMVRDVLKETGITATVGIGTNLYLCKVAMDVVAKHCEPDEQGVRIAELDETTYRKTMWEHQPLTDFWRLGRGTEKTLLKNGITTQKQIAIISLSDEERLYKLFGKNAELLIDHAWGYEPCTIEAIHNYKPDARSLSVGQVLKEPYSADKALIVLKEMAEGLASDLFSKRLKTNQVVLTICYDISNMKNFKGEVHNDFYGRIAPKNSHGSENLESFTFLANDIIKATERLFNRIVNPKLTIRRIYLGINNVDELLKQYSAEQLSLFDNNTEKKQDIMEEERQKAILKIRNEFGKNAILRGISLEKGATAKERNNLIGGHKK